MGLELAEELESLEPVGAGNPPVTLLVPSALCDDPRPMGEGRHLPSPSRRAAPGRARSFGRGASLPAEPGTPVDAAVRLEVNHYNGAVEPRLVLRSVAAPAAAPIAVLGEPETFAAGLRAELDRPLDRVAAPAPPAEGRAVRDARGHGIAGLWPTSLHTGEPVLVLAAHAQQRARRPRAGSAASRWRPTRRSRPIRGCRAVRPRRLPRSAVGAVRGGRRGPHPPGLGPP